MRATLIALFCSAIAGSLDPDVDLISGQQVSVGALGGSVDSWKGNNLSGQSPTLGFNGESGTIGAGRWLSEADAPGRRLSGASSAKLCPTGTAEEPGSDSQVGKMLLTSGSGLNAINMYDGSSGYSSYLSCRWDIEPVDRSSMTLVFERADIACCDDDAIEVTVLRCKAAPEGGEFCQSRERVLVLRYPASFDDIGQIPPSITVEEEQGKSVKVQIRFVSRMYTGMKGFSASYTTVAFDAMLVKPQLIPHTMMTTMTIQGIGFSSAKELKCRLQGDDLLFVPATVVADSDTTATCVIDASSRRTTSTPLRLAAARPAPR